MNDHENRIEALEQWQEQVNGNIAALQQLLSTTDYITKVTPVTEDGRQVGYTIEFLNQSPITIYNGEKGDTGQPGADGNDGQTPEIGLMKDADGNWYWTLNGELMLDQDMTATTVLTESPASPAPTASREPPPRRRR